MFKGDSAQQICVDPGDGKSYEVHNDKLNNVHNGQKDPQKRKLSV